MAAELTVETSGGPARVDVSTPAGRAVGTVVLTHGAGGGTGARDLQALAAAGRDAGFVVVAVEQPYRVAGRRAPPAPDRQDATWHEVLTALDRARRLDRARPLIVAGRSNGARVACRTATHWGAAGVVALAFPVHPPGRPERSRLAELAAPTCPVLVVQGDRDPFGMPGRRRGRRVVLVPGTDHSLRGADQVVAREARAFLRRVARGTATAD